MKNLRRASVTARNDLQMIIFAAIFFLTSFVFAVEPFVADSFDASKTDHIVKRGDFTGAKKPEARVPFVKSNIVQDEERGKVLEISYNVSEGFGGSFIIFKEAKIPENFNTVRFWLRGTKSPFKIEVKDDLIHSYIIPKEERNTWREVVIPISEFSNYKDLNKKKIKEFVFVFEDHRTSPRLGTIYVDDLSFSEEKVEEKVEMLPQPGPVLVSGEVSGGNEFNVSQIEVLKLSSRLVTRGEFDTFRFEASSDGGKHWFYLAEFPAADKKAFEYTWRIKSFPTGVYALRAVTVNKKGDRSEGPSDEFSIRNFFDFEKFLDELQHKTFNYFVEQVEPKSYLVKDRSKPGSVFSTGLSGFQWTIYVIGVERGWMEREEAVRRINESLDFFLNHTRRYHGLLPHWLDSARNEVWEIGMGDAVETSYIIAGGIVARTYFDQNSPLEVSLREKIEKLIEGVEWNALLKRAKPKDEKGFIPWHWIDKKGASHTEVRGYNEAMITYLLGLGSPYHPLPDLSWKAWLSTYQRGSYGPHELIACAPLFTHQYTHLWVDFRNIQDAYANYFENSIQATLANREFSLKENGYSGEIWGLTASDGPGGYKAYGAPPFVSVVPPLNDGTIAPTAAGTSMMFTPELSKAALKDIKELYGSEIWGEYGFKDALNPKLKWFADEYLGLDQGPLVIGIENYRTGLIWKLVMKDPYIRKGLERAGFRKTENNVGA